MEVLDAQFEKAKVCARIGDKAGAYAAYNTIAEKAKISTGKKIDAVMAKTRVALFYLETQQVPICVYVCVCGTMFAQVIAKTTQFTRRHDDGSRCLSFLAC